MTGLAPSICARICAMETVSLAEFQKLDLRVGEIKEVLEVPGLDKIWKLRVDLGELGERAILAGLRGFLTAEDLVGREIVVVVNLEPKAIRGEVSEGMLLAADPPAGEAGVDGRPVLIMPCEKVVTGTTIR